ncbi:Conserved_hypothetical protein [Hexamita inflata]|uniref:Uncharacterized protein n=1 Tax=Hexamita inflata TaxID=28002 RepID=A0AA86TP51_9EUKA|nr:Conserved hypothetical protein [Hexamita inflata]
MDSPPEMETEQVEINYDNIPIEPPAKQFKIPKVIQKAPNKRGAPQKAKPLKPKSTKKPKKVKIVPPNSHEQLRIEQVEDATPVKPQQAPCAHCTQYAEMLRDLALLANGEQLQSLTTCYQTVRSALKSQNIPKLEKPQNNQNLFLRQELGRAKTELARVSDHVNKSKLVFNKAQPVSEQIGEVFKIYYQKIEQIIALQEMNKNLKAQNLKFQRNMSGLGYQQGEELKTQLNQAQNELQEQKEQNELLQNQIKQVLDINYQLQDNCQKFKLLNDQLNMKQAFNFDLSQIENTISYIQQMGEELKIEFTSKTQQIQKTFFKVNEKVENVFIEVWALKNKDKVVENDNEEF